MEAKLKMYYRCENDIRQILFPVVLNWVKASIKDNDDIKIANSPQELIEEKDIIEILYSGNRTYYKLEVIKVTDKVLETSHMTIAKSQLHDFLYGKNLKKLPMIKSIRTPNGKDYICQWEVS